MPHIRDTLTWLTAEDEGFGPATEVGDSPPTLAFDDFERFRVGEVEFHCSARGESTPDRFFIRKNRALIEDYLDVLDGFQEANVVELGIADGGSVALMMLVAHPRKLVGLELDETPVAGLAELIERRDLTARVSPQYGVDQGDRARLRDIIGAEFAEEPLDLVIDDASHRLDETRASFETLFPRLREGGLYVIEDWHQQNFSRALGEALADPEVQAELDRRMAAERREASADTSPTRKAGPPHGHAVATAMILELVLAQAESEEFMSEVAIRPRQVRVRRGPAALDPVTFRLSDLFTDHLGLLGSDRWP